ncbi:MAG: methylated-DNA--[protein]-cysteine S-methyltransferase [Chloroflexi bacterium]|nr:methylated-DNA--[protein]-cysteine S-methyltransferase [Chloroflexota bacterium]
MVFFKVPELARQAGFRACKRCRPDTHTLSDPQLELVRSICHYIEQHAAEPITLQTLSQCFNVSAWHLQRTFKEYVGISPLEYTEACRMDQLKHALRHGVPITDAIYEAGFGSSSRVYEKAAPQLGMTPRRYQRNGTGAQIQFTVVPSALGQLLVATTERGVCAIKLGDDPGELERLLFGEFSAAHIGRNDEAHKDWVQAILDFTAGKEPHLDLPLDVRATAFQKQVWQALQKIPYGETRTYADIAREIGNPKAIRAVGNACGANPTALMQSAVMMLTHLGEHVASARV